MLKSRPLTIAECCDILECCYLVGGHPYPMGLGLRQSIEYLKEYNEESSKTLAKRV